MLKTPARCLTVLALLATAQAAHKPASKPGKETSHAEVIGFWRFERDVKPEAHGYAGPVKRVDDAEFYFTDEVPGPYIYDPLLKLSYPNSASLNFQSSEGHNDALQIALNLAKANLAGQSVTLEMFFKPDNEWDSPLAMKARASDAASEWGLEARFYAQQRQTYLNAFFTAPGGQTIHFRGGHLGSSAQIRTDNPTWRHMAFIYDANAGTLTSCIDYYQSKTVPLPGGMTWDAGSFYIGGGPNGSGFAGRIDEVRLTKGALRPSQFLRARQDPIANVSFETVETLLPRDSGYIDLKEAFGAVGDGRTDDTAAFRAAFAALSDREPLAHYTLYIPPGTYLVSDTLQSGHALDIQGAGSDKTVIKLRDKCPGFSRAAEPHAFWEVDHPAAPAQANAPAESGTSISMCNLSIDIGKGNPGAKGLVIASGRVRCLEDLQLRSADGSGVVALQTPPQAGAAMAVKNVRVKGFRVEGPSDILSRPATGNAPEIPWGDIHKDWVSIEKFADKKAGDDWAPAIQAAIDSGARTVYFPPEHYDVAGAIHLHGKIDRLFGLHSRIGHASGFAAEEPVLILDEKDPKRAYSLEGLEIEGVRQASPAALVLKNTEPVHCERVEGCGKLFANGNGLPSPVAAAPQGAQ
jgi:hypothetical protein